MNTVAIVGVGLIGASFGLALRKTGFTGLILGVSSAPAIQAGVAAGAISRSATLKEAADLADFIYLAQPVDQIIESLGWLGPMARKETVITDAGSTKAAIVKAATDYLQYAQFVGGHPLAGKEARGAQAADADLFRNRPYVLTEVGIPVPQVLLDLLQRIGAVVQTMSPAEHDSIVAMTSHLPQLISTSLAALLAKQDSPSIKKIFGSGLLDMTRLALSPADLWSSILATNKDNVIHALDLYTAALAELRTSIEADEIAAAFTAASAFVTDLRKLTY